MNTQKLHIKVLILELNRFSWPKIDYLASMREMSILRTMLKKFASYSFDVLYVFVINIILMHYRLACENA